jgi:hypothetical protein
MPDHSHSCFAWSIESYRLDSRELWLDFYQAFYELRLIAITNHELISVALHSDQKGSALLLGPCPGEHGVHAVRGV